MKILIIRFSSIGDIVLTTPIIRAIKQQIQGVELHYITKQKFSSVIEANPYIDKIHTIKDSIFEITHQLKKENFDYVIDLHHNMRTLKLKWILGKKSFSFRKLNWEKFLIVYFKINKLPKLHIVDRYFETLYSIGVKNDSQGLDYFISEKDIVNVSSYLPTYFQNGYTVLVVGGSYFTKQIPINKLKEFCERSSKPLVLLGGKEDALNAEEVHKAFLGKTINLCGQLNINQSASIIQQAEQVITSDTGLMHIAAAFKKNIISVWGNTIPEFGMGVYLPSNNSKIVEVKNLPCRPCSKLGHHSCPKKHFKCMNDIVIGDL
jgi:ADP-heptose:LPS heptosyltransferase